MGLFHDIKMRHRRAMQDEALVELRRSRTQQIAATRLSTDPQCIRYLLWERDLKSREVIGSDFANLTEEPAPRRWAEIRGRHEAAWAAEVISKVRKHGAAADAAQALGVRRSALDDWLQRRGHPRCTALIQEVQS